LTVSKLVVAVVTFGAKVTMQSGMLT